MGNRTRRIAEILGRANHSTGKMSADTVDVSFENITDTGTEGTKVATGGTAQRGSTTGQWRYNTDTGFFEGINSGGAISSLEPDPIVTSVDDGEVDSAAGGNQTIVVTGLNFTSGGTITFVGSSAEFDADTTTFNNATQVTAVAPKSSFLNAQEPYKVKFTSATGKSGISATGLISVDNAPTFGVASGSLGTLPNGNRASSGITTVTATDADGDAITFSQLSGTLPTGITFNSDGTFSGTANAEASTTTYTFTIRATAGGKTTDRQYTITVNAPTSQTFSYTGSVQTLTVPSGVTSMTVDLRGAGGGSQGNAGAGGTGGKTTGTLAVSGGQVLYIVVGGAGRLSTGAAFGGGGYYTAGNGNGGGGGGYSGIFLSSVSFANAKAIAGGGGGGAYGGNSGGSGGGTTGGNSSGGDATSTGGSQGSGGSGATSGSQLQGGTANGNGNGGAGGGGYYGGGGGSESGNDYGGGGGSGYIGGLTSATTTNAQGSSANTNGVIYITY